LREQPALKARIARRRNLRTKDTLFMMVPPKTHLG
jgi:hypothetical protein